MCDVAVCSGITETVILGEDISAIKMPQSFTYDYLSGSGVLQLYSSSSTPNEIVGSETYSSYDRVRYHGSTAGVAS